MVAKAKAETLKKREARKEMDALLDRAATAYRLELDKPDGVAQMGSRSVATHFEELYFQETNGKKRIKLNHTTIIKRANGGQSQTEASRTREWLIPEETEIVVNLLKQSADQGFPFTHRRLKEVVDKILRARLGDAFPEDGVGKRWTHRFIEKHNDILKMAWSTPLETKRAKAVNENTNKAYFNLLKTTLETYGILPHNIYGVDEVGIQPYGADRERVIGGTGPGPQYQQRTGNRENITVLVSICADGTALPPGVIFKGKGYQVRWKQDNPVDAS